MGKDDVMTNIMKQIVGMVTTPHPSLLDWCNGQFDQGYSITWNECHSHSW